MDIDLTELVGMNKPQLKSIAKTLKLRGYSSKKKSDLIEFIKTNIENKKQIAINKIVSSDAKIKHIYHFADLHIRPVNRIDEYNSILTKVCNKLKELPKGLVVVAGDIFHEKINNRPDGNMFCRKFFKQIANIMPVIIIPGNHDIFHKEANRTLNLSVVLDDIPNVHFWIKSGVYNYGEIDFGLSSAIDDEYIPASSIKTDNIKIALYHGTVENAITDMGFKITEDKARFSTSDFKGYDYVLLGDIHKMQFLKDNIAYSGSLIQQNHGEKIGGHGFIHWDLTKGIGDFIDVPNDYGFVQINIEDGSIKSMSAEPLPKYSYIRIMNKNTSPKQMEVIQQVLKEQTNIIRIEERRVHSIKDESDGKDEIRSLGSFSEILEEFIRAKFTDVSEEEIKELGQLNSDCMEKYNIVLNDSICSKWKPLEIKFKNFMSYGKDEEHIINFNELKGTTSITGKNASGKSTIMLLFVYSLFGKSFHDKYRVDYFVNKNYPKLDIEFKFQVGENDLYLIKRNVSKQKRANGDISYKPKLKVYKIDTNGTKIDISVTSAGGTQTIINRLIGSGKDLFRTNILSNTLSTDFMQHSSTKKMDELRTLIKLDFCETLRDKTRKDHCKMLSDIQKIEAKYEAVAESSDITVAELTKKIKSNRNSLDQSLKILEQEKSRLLVEKKKLCDLEKRKFELIKHYKEIDEIIFNKKLLQQLKKLKKKYPEIKNNEELLLRKGEIKMLLKDTENIKEIELKNQLKYENMFLQEDFDKLDERKTEIKSEHSKIKSELIKLKKELVEYDKPKDYVSCSENINGLELKISILTDSLTLISNEVSNVDDSSIGLSKGELNLLLDNAVSEQEITDLIKDINSKKLSRKKILPLLERVQKFNNPHKAIEIQKNITGLQIKKEEYEEQQKIIMKNKQINKNIAENKWKIECANYTLYIKNKDSIKETKQKLHELSDLFSKIKKEIDDKKTNNILLEQYNKIIKNKPLIDELIEIQEQLDLIKLCENYEKYKKNKEKEKVNKTLKKDENELDHNIHTINIRINDIQTVITTLETQTGIIKRDIEEYNSKKDKLVIIEKEQEDRRLELEDLKLIYARIALYIKILDKQNIQKYILMEQIERLVHYVNEFLEIFTEFKIELDVMEQGNKLGFNISKKGMCFSYIQMSGYERFMMNIGIKKALAQLSFQNKAEIMFIDEGLDCLDSGHFNQLYNVFGNLENHFGNVFVISHIEKLNEFAHNNIRIIKEEGYSSII